MVTALAFWYCTKILEKTKLKVKVYLNVPLHSFVHIQPYFAEYHSSAARARLLTSLGPGEREQGVYKSLIQMHDMAAVFLCPSWFPI